MKRGKTQDYLDYMVESSLGMNKGEDFSRGKAERSS